MIAEKFGIDEAMKVGMTDERWKKHIENSKAEWFDH